ncbi:MAG TPA: flagellar protein FlaG [Methylophilaceae bacterium]|jgi:flagellar protein FlaG
MDITQVSSAVAQFAASVANPAAASAPAPSSTPAPQPAPASTQSKHVDEKDLVQAVNQINQIVQSVNPGVEFTIESGSNAVIVKVLDVQSQEVIRQFPSEAALSIAQALDNLRGVLLTNKS